MSKAKGARALGMAAGRELGDLASRQTANRARKVAARQESKARRKANREAWEKLDYPSGYSDSLPLSRHFTKPTRTADKKFNEFSRKAGSDPYDYEPSFEELEIVLKPLMNRAGLRGVRKSFSIEDSRVLQKIAKARRESPDILLDEHANILNRLVQDLPEGSKADAVEQLLSLLPSWQGSSGELVALIRMGVL
jgi:hypothetical protein